MITWVLENLGTIIVTLILITVVSFIIRGMIRDKKQGKSSCGSNCAHCAMGGSCHKK